MENAGYRFGEFYISDRMMPSITRYIEWGIIPGDFLFAVLENNLFETFARGDKENLENLRAFIGYFYNEAPSQCFGSPEKVRAWVAAHMELER